MQRFEWTADQQIYLISAYFIGYIFSNLYGGILAERFGATRTISFILLAAVPIVASIPHVVVLGYWPIFGLRIFQGVIEVRCECVINRVIFTQQMLLQGPLYPAIQHLIVFWCPPCEKGRFICVFAGSSFGSLIGHGIVAVTVDNWGWPSSFYTVTVIGALVSVYWMWIVADRPDLHSRVTDKERIYIESAIAGSVHKETVRSGNEVLVEIFPQDKMLHSRKRFPT